MTAAPSRGGDLRALRVGAGAGTAAEVGIVAPDPVHRCATFWTGRDRLLHDGVEYRVNPSGERADRDRRPTD